MKKIALVLLLASLAACSSTATQGGVRHPISENEVLAAQNAWCAALVAISKSYEESGAEAAKALAEKVIDEAYGYQMGVVLFKPTLTINPQTFRGTRAGALSYFVGGDPAFPNDGGFALKGWTKCEAENTGILLTADSGSSMGKVHFTNKDGKVTSVDKTWTFVKDEAGQARIVIHHSSLEFSGN